MQEFLGSIASTDWREITTYVNTPTLMVSWVLLAGEVWKCRL